MVRAQQTKNDECVGERVAARASTSATKGDDDDEKEKERSGRKGENKRSNAGAETHSSVRDADDGIPTRTRTAVDGGRFSVRFAQLERGDESRRGERSEMPTAREPAVAEIL